MRKLSKNDPLKNQQPQRWRTTIVIHFVSVLRWQKEKQRTSKDKQTERCKPANSKRRIQIDENEENILLQAKPTQKSRKKTRRKLHQQNLRPTVEKQRQRRSWTAANTEPEKQRQSGRHRPFCGRNAATVTHQRKAIILSLRASAAAEEYSVSR